MTDHEIATMKREIADKKAAEELADSLGNFVNAFGYDHQSFIERVIYRTHRTLQQSIGGLVFKLIKAWAKAYEDGVYDGRNEQLCKTCACIDRVMTETDVTMGEHWDHLPCI